MSNPYYRSLSLAGMDFSGLSEAQLRALVREVLERKIHGLSFSPYVEGQGPGTLLSEAQVRERLAVIQPYVKWIRSFSTTDGNEWIPRIAREMGLKTMVGVWLDDDREHNAQEMANARQLVEEGCVDILAVGNEVLLRDDLSEDELLEYMAQARRDCPSVEVGYVDAYFKFVDHPRVADACDVILANCYPFWEGCPAEVSLLYMKEMYRRAVSAAGGKRVIVSETGWPNIGTPTDGAIPSLENALKYFLNTFQWAEDDGIEVIYFGAFDEAWKVAKEGDVGAYWGLWDKDGHAKYC
jgi:exo-beta-1,3-glucanase (GH17 family)